MIIETRAEQSRAASPRLPRLLTAKGRYFELKSRQETRKNWKQQRTMPHRQLRKDMAMGEVAAKIQAHVIVAVAQ